MARASFKLSDIEKQAKGKDVVSITIKYSNKDLEYCYFWKDRKIIRWNNVIRCRLDLTKSKTYNINGEACKRVGLRLKPK